MSHELADKIFYELPGMRLREYLDNTITSYLRGKVEEIAGIEFPVRPTPYNLVRLDEIFGLEPEGASVKCGPMCRSGRHEPGCVNETKKEKPVSGECWCKTATQWNADWKFCPECGTQATRPAERKRLADVIKEWSRKGTAYTESGIDLNKDPICNIGCKRLAAAITEHICELAKAQKGDLLISKESLLKSLESER